MILFGKNISGLNLIISYNRIFGNTLWPAYLGKKNGVPFKVLLIFLNLLFLVVICIYSSWVIYVLFDTHEMTERFGERQWLLMALFGCSHFFMGEIAFENVQFDLDTQMII